MVFLVEPVLGQLIKCLAEEQNTVTLLTSNSKALPTEPPGTAVLITFELTKLNVVGILLNT